MVCVRPAWQVTQVAMRSLSLGRDALEVLGDTAFSMAVWICDQLELPVSAPLGAPLGE